MPLDIVWTPELVIAFGALFGAIASPFITLAALYYKHQLDMAQYRNLPGAVTESVSPQISHVQETLENGIKHTIADTNRKVAELRDEVISNRWKEGC